MAGARPVSAWRAAVVGGEAVYVADFRHVILGFPQMTFADTPKRRNIISIFIVLLCARSFHATMAIH